MIARLRTANALLVMGNTGVEYQWRFQVAVAGLTAQPLADVFFGLLSERQDFEHDDQAKPLVKKARSEINQLIQARNNLMHGDWLAPFHDDDAESSTLMRIKAARSQGAMELLPQSVADLDGLADDATRLHWVITVISASTLKNPDGTRRELPLKLNDDGKVTTD